jgi:hypothetical protein
MDILYLICEAFLARNIALIATKFRRGSSTSFVRDLNDEVKKEMDERNVGMCSMTDDQLLEKQLKLFELYNYFDQQYEDACRTCIRLKDIFIINTRCKKINC